MHIRFRGSKLFSLFLDSLFDNVCGQDNVIMCSTDTGKMTRNQEGKVA